MFKKSKCAFAAKLGVTMLLSMTSISLFPNLVKDAGIVYAIKVVNSSNIEKCLNIVKGKGGQIIKVCLKVPEKYSKIDKDALQNLPQNIKNNLKTVNLQGIEEVPDGLFSNFPDLEEVTIGDKCTKIGKSAFSGCQKLNKIEFGKNCAVIEDSAFEGCRDLRFVKFSENLQSIGEKSFFKTDIRWLKLEKCNKLENLGPFCFSACPKLYKVDLPENGNSQTIINDWCFSECPIEKITIPKNIKSIGAGCFSRCIKLNNIIFNNKSELNSLGNWCFSGCPFVSIDIPNSVESIGKGCFSGCTKLTTFSLPENIKLVGDNCFYNCLSLLNVNIPQAIDSNSVGVDIFDGCSKLESVNIPRHWEKLPNGIFCNCKSINWSNVDLSNIKYYGDRCFKGCNLPLSFKISDKVNELGEECLAYSNIENISIPTQVIKIKKGAFSGLNIRNISIPKNIQLMEPSIFSNCKQLEKVYMDQDLKASIGTHFFADCPRLKGAVVPSGCHVQGKWIFARDNNLYSVEISDNKPDLGAGCFEDDKKLTILAFPNINVKEFCNDGKIFKAVNKKAIILSSPPLIGSEVEQLD